jgi:hypothetical protein
MKRKMWIALVAALMSWTGADSADAGLFCGMGGYDCCPPSCCAPSGEYCQARISHCPSYRTVQETVWETEEYCCPETVYETCMEKVPVTCTRTVYDTCYRDECSRATRRATRPSAAR